MVEIEKTESFNEIDGIWGRLYNENESLTYYQSPEFMRTLWENILPYRVILRVKPVFYVFKKDNQPVFILPLFKTILKNEYVLFGRKAGVGYLDAVYKDDITDEEFKECFEVLKKDTRVSFEHVRSETALGRWLLTDGGEISGEGCTEIPLPDSYEDYYRALSKHMRQNIRTAYNRLKTDGGEIKYEFYDYSEMPDELYDRLQRMYIDRQINRYGKSKLYKYFVKYVDIGTKIQKSKRIKEKAFVLKINGEIAAYYDAIYADDGKTVIVPRLAIADGFNRYSPGMMLINESIKTLIGEKIKCMDLTHGTEPYKLSMGGVEKYCVEGVI